MSQLNEMNVKPHTLDTNHENTERTISAKDLSAIFDEVSTHYTLPIYFYLDRYDSALLPTTETVNIEYSTVDVPAHYRGVEFVDPVTYELMTLTGTFEHLTKFSVRVNVYKDAVEILLITKIQILRRIEDNRFIIEHKN